MYKKAIEVLNIFFNNGFEAYIVGGYVRDKLLDIKTNDIDICTNAKPKDIVKLFDIQSSDETQYGAVKIIYKNYNFDVTTFRKDIKYEDNRRPIKIKYINDLKKDLLRRDFTINTFCIDKDENVIDILNVKEDINRRIIKTVGNPRYKIKEDSLRILRAIRFASVLDLEIDSKTKAYIKKYGKLLKKLSYNRKKDELEKIFSAKNKEKGRDYLIELNLLDDLEIFNLKDITLCDYIIGNWVQLNVDDKYPFTKLEKEQMKKIRELLELDLFDKYNIYKYGLYVSTVVAQIKNEDFNIVSKIHNELPIRSIKDININGLDICKILDRKPDKFIKDIYSDLEKEIIYNRLNNEFDYIKEYIEKKYLI